MRVWKFKKILIICLSFFLPLSVLWGAMNSPSYSIPSDTINIGGGDSASPTYNLGDTIGEIGTGDSASNNFAIRAGFRQMQTGYISISAENDVPLSSINGLSGGVSTSSNAWTVVTDNQAGYSLSIRASTAPALQASPTLSFGDYTPSGAYPDYSFGILPSQSLFGFSPEGVDIIDLYRDNGSACNTGALDTADACWDGLSTTDKPVAERALSNHPAGTITTIKYRAEIGTAVLQESGVYSAAVTVTAVMLLII